MRPFDRSLATVLALTASMSSTAYASSSAVRLYPGEVSSAKTEINFQLVDSGKDGVFARAEADYSLGKIRLVTLAEGRVEHTRAVGFSDPRYKDSDPWLSPSGDELYFISDRPAYLGDVREDEDDYDIWRSRRHGEYWTAPEHLAAVNSRRGEFGPEIHGEYLYFSSQKRGRYEIYRAPREGDGFGEPVLLPEPINGPYKNSDFTLSKDGRLALWWSTRPGGLGSGDLYLSRLTDSGWSAATNLGPEVNSAYVDFTPSLSPDSATLYFASNRPVTGQDEGASDVYVIAVKDVEPLRQAISAMTLERLKGAFGGDSALSAIDSVSYRLASEGPGIAASAEQVYIDFRSCTIAVRDASEATYRIASVRDGDSSYQDGELAEGDLREDLIATLSANFLFYLTAENLALIGPEPIAGHGDLIWYRLEARGQVSPILGIDPLSGRVLKVLTGSGASVLELEYLKTDSGLIWPYRFDVMRGGEATLSGRFSELRLNGAAPDQLPSWVQEKRACGGK